VASLCHPWFTTTSLSYRFPILKLPPPPCAVLLVIIYLQVKSHFLGSNPNSARWTPYFSDGSLPKFSKFLMLQKTSAYSGWKKSCTTLDGWNPINNGINHLSTGAGFLPSTVSHLLQDLVTFSFATNQPHTRAPMSNMLPDFLITGPDFAWKGYGGDGTMGGNSFYGKSHGNHMELCHYFLWGNELMCFFYFSTWCVFKRWEKQKIVVSEPGHEMTHPSVGALASQKVRLTHSKKNVIETIEFWVLNNLVLSTNCKLRFVEGPEAR